jgi:hypothetical protein
MPAETTIQIIRRHWAAVARVLPAALSSSLWADKTVNPEETYVRRAP